MAVQLTDFSVFYSQDSVANAEASLKDKGSKIVVEKGQIVKNPTGGGRYVASPYTFYANREAPEEDVKGLARLKGHLQKGRWLTKFRKIVRKDEMSDDLVLVPVSDKLEQDYVRIMPTSPP